MKTLQIVFTLLVACLFFVADAEAQRGGRGGDRGSRGDFGGRGGDAGGRPSFGGDRGGRPSFGGGGPSFGGRPSFGGDTGGRPSFGGRGGDSGSRGFDPMSRMDRNGDGKIDQSEIDAVPSFMRDAMKQRGIEMKPGSLDDVRNSIRTQMERVRAEGGWGRPGGGDSSTSNRQRYAPASSFRPREKERLTVDLPEDYMGVDANADGQVALHEWILTRRKEMTMFEQIDKNGDGILTPVELVAYENQRDDEEETEKWIRERLVIVGPGSSSGGRSSGGSSSSRGDRKDDKRDAKDEKQKHEQFASYAFRTMDKNKNGRMDPEEWESSRRVRPMFENAGIKLTAMDADEFSKRYVKAAMSGKK